MGDTSCNEKNLAGILRSMAWQRAKGELMSILETFWNEKDDFEKLEIILESFIRKVEDETSLV